MFLFAYFTILVLVRFLIYVVDVTQYFKVEVTSVQRVFHAHHYMGVCVYIPAMLRQLL